MVQILVFTKSQLHLIANLLGDSINYLDNWNHGIKSNPGSSDPL